ncbi:flagellar hook-associated protein FlgK [Alkalibacterium pelagium]|uniref:Flagellar hook-associated protein 1 n=1 Tax=Alkalibacterium pelagium TaxID=426702 RepID=A0A1H7H7M0_9LACT|nr:flagellar hook-associated protein FlgK [Alkalibacterium pelagium]GEN51548.1 flagellar hook-associated protein 1 [Alkalibacterium pelagium]SEK46396.1 flagellar hook-associated protein 1 FlgK [Alkalibacterium pelagium]
MSGLFGTLNTATKGLNAQQTALQTIGHNVANANTTGYTRQRVTMQADLAQSVAGVGQIGTGVRIGNIDRVSDQYVNTQLRDAHSTTEKHKSLSDIIGQLEATFNEPSDTGLSNQISEVFNAWTYLASNPEQASARTMLVQTTETFTDTIHHMANSMDSLHKDTLNELDKSALDANSTLKQLENLNHQIWQASVRGFTPNDLLDQQDRLLTDLAGKVDITVERDRFNRVSVDVAGTNVLDSSSRKELAVVTKEENGTFYLSNGDSVEGPEGENLIGKVIVKNEAGSATFINPQKGSMKGTQDALGVISDMQSDLNEFAFSFATAVNLIHSNGGDYDNGGVEFFNNGELTKENAALNIRVSESLRKNPENVVSGKDLNNTFSGDGSRAQAIAGLQYQNLSLNSESWTFNQDSMKIEGSGVGSTLFSRYNSMVTEMGIVKQQEDNMLDTQSALMHLLTQRRESISGVDINEEVVDMIRYSSAFQANSRVLQTISEMLDTLINRTGV